MGSATAARALTVGLSGLFGLVIGSFLNVVVYRVPQGLSIARPPSHCPACQHELAPYDNIPLLSWVVLRGRCRTCRAPISPRYPMIEAVTALTFAGMALALPGPLALPSLLLVAAAAIAAVAIDFDGLAIPWSVAAPWRWERSLWRQCQRRWATPGGSDGRPSGRCSPGSSAPGHRGHPTWRGYRRALRIGHCTVRHPVAAGRPAGRCPGLERRMAVAGLGPGPGGMGLVAVGIAALWGPVGAPATPGRVLAGTGASVRYSPVLRSGGPDIGGRASTGRRPARAGPATSDSQWPRDPGARASPAGRAGWSRPGRRRAA